MQRFILFLMTVFLCGCSLFSESAKTADTCLSLSRVDCFDCLVEINPKGYRQYQTSIVENCHCGFECIGECEAYCAESPELELEPDEDCASCFNVVSQTPQSLCISDLLEQCEEEDDCLKFISDLQSCPSGTTPP